VGQHNSGDEEEGWGDSWLMPSLIFKNVHANKNFFSSIAGTLRTSLPTRAFCQTCCQETVDSKQSRNLGEVEKLMP
jgi:hypothetical protein